MKRSASFLFAAGLLVAGGYLFFTLMAYVRYPLPYAPGQNWLSDLGNPDRNPSGAVFYNAGIAVTAALVLAFFAGFTRFRLEGHRAQNVMLALAVFFGSLGALGMAMSAVYPINHPAEHSLWCKVLYFGLGTGFAFTVAALRYHRACPRPLLWFGVLVVAVNLATQALFTEVKLFEWINVALFLAYVLALGIQARRMDLRPRIQQAFSS